jgi:hypothetical protein
MQLTQHSNRNATMVKKLSHRCFPNPAIATQLLKGSYSMQLSQRSYSNENIAMEQFQWSYRNAAMPMQLF